MPLVVRPAQVAYIDSTQTFSGAKTFSANITLSDVDIVLGTTTGTKIGTATTQKLAFYNSTPIVKASGVAVTAAGIHAACVNLGLFAA